MAKLIKDHGIDIAHELMKQNGKVVFRKFRDGGYDHFKIRLFLTGDLSQIRSVEYELHPTFPDPRREVTRREGGFPLVIWTWGEFEVHVTLHFADGDVAEKYYQLKYSDELPADPKDYYEISRTGVRS